MKRTLFILGALLIVAAVILLGWWFRYRGSGLELLGNENATGTLPTPRFGDGTGTGNATGGSATLAKPITDLGNVKDQLALVVDIPTAAYFVDTKNNVTVVGPDGTITRISRGQKTTLNSTKVQNLISASFSFDGQKILAIFGVHLNPQASVFDIATKAWQPLVESFKSASWSPGAEKLVYISTMGGLSALKTLDASDPKASPQELIKLHAEDLVVTWVSSRELFIEGRGSALVPTSGFFYLLGTKTIVPTFEERFGATTLWDTSGLGLILGSGSSGRTGSLSLINKTGSSLRTLNLLTLPSKCAFMRQVAAGTSTQPVEITHLACGVPRDVKLLTSANIPDDYLQKSFFTSDDFYKIDLKTGNIDSVFTSLEKRLDADNVRTFNNRLFFVNRYDQKLYTLSL